MTPHLLAGLCLALLTTLGCDAGPTETKGIPPCPLTELAGDPATRDACDAVDQPPLALGGPETLTRLQVDISDGGEIAVVGADGGGVSLWQILGDRVTHIDVWRGAVEAGPWVVWTNQRRPLVVWGAASAGVRAWTSAEAGVVVVDATRTPSAVVAVPLGAKVLSEGAETWQILTLSSDGQLIQSHFANSVGRVGAAIAMNREDDNIVVAYADRTPEQGLWFLTADVSIGQCSLPAAFDGASLGPAASLVGVTLSNGASVFAIQPPDTDCRPAGQLRLQTLTGGATYPVSQPLEPGATLVALGGVAALVTTETTPEDPPQWQPAARYVDLRRPGLGARGVGPLSAGERPEVWSVARGRDGWVMVAAGTDGLVLQRFCFR